jgi:predicted membrane protein
MDDKPLPAFAPPRVTPRLILGLALIFFGVLFTLDNFGILDASEIWQFWPLVLVAMGLARLWTRTLWRDPAGIVFLVLGVAFTLRNFGLLRFHLSYLFPLILVFFGAKIVLGHLPRSRARFSLPGRTEAPVAAADAAGRLNDWAVFGGVNRRFAGSVFSGGEVSATFGGFSLDLRGATMTGDEARIDVFAFCGGGDIKIPEDWNVSVNVVPLFGGTDDKSRHPLPEPGKTVKQLVVTGYVIFGGVGIKN